MKVGDNIYGYLIKYIDEYGKEEMTFFHDIEYIGNININKSQKDMVLMMFKNSYPKRKIISIKKCSFDDFEKLSKIKD